jgi:hypothetical protein
MQFGVDSFKAYKIRTSAFRPKTLRNSRNESLLAARVGHFRSSALKTRRDTVISRSIRRRFQAAWRGKLLGEQPWQFKGAFGTRPETLAKTIVYEEGSEAVACYLCNTCQQTRVPSPLRAVPLLRVHFRSVIVSERRRGASRGRPVLGGSLKSLAFMRVCPKARSD